MKRLNDQAEN